MEEFQHTLRNGAKVRAHYMIDQGILSVTYRGETMSVTSGLNEIANAFLRGNLMQSILGEIEVAPKGDTEDILSLTSGTP